MWKTIRVNMKSRVIKEEEYKKEYLGLGGRGLIAQFMTDEVNPKCDPLGPENKLILCTTCFANMGITTCNRLSVGGKSPLTGGIKEANAGGTAAAYMANHGIRMIVIEDQPKEDGLWLLRIDAQGQATLEDAKEFAGMNNYALVEALFKKYGQKISSITIGGAGEKLYRNSSLQVTEYGSNHPSRSAARGGLGAVLGSKRIKAVVIEQVDPQKRFRFDQYADKAAFENTKKTFNKKILDLVQSGFPLANTGTVNSLTPAAKFNIIPINNFSGKKLEYTDRVDINALTEIVKAHGKNKVPCQAGCLIHCSNRIDEEDGTYLTSGFEYETVALCGPNIGIYDLMKIARFDRICDDFGLDTIETGATLGVCMEAGKIAWGDANAAMGLIQEMMDGTEFGQVLGAGTEATGKYLGVSHLPVCKHQAMAGYDPRGTKGCGVNYATTPMGADHTTGNIMVRDLGKTSEELIAMSQDAQVEFAIYDNAFCQFAGMMAARDDMQLLSDIHAAVYGGVSGPKRMHDLGEKTIHLEIAFNRAAGLTEADDSMPEFFCTEPNESGVVFDVPQESLPGVWKF